MGKGKRNKAKKNASPAQAGPSASDSGNAEAYARPRPAPTPENHLEYGSFLSSIEHTDTFTFGQLQRHPLLLSPSERVQLLDRGFALCSDMAGDLWKEEYKQAIRRNVDIYGIIGDKEGFSGVLFAKEVGYYEPNALGAFMYSVDALARVNDYLVVGAKKTPEQVAEMLYVFFPELFVDVYTFLTLKRVDIVALI